MLKQNDNGSILDVFKWHMSSAPVDVFELARDLDIIIKEEKLGSEISGSIESIGDRFKITVNQADSNNRKRFTVAHELGHFMLHSRLINSGITDNKLYRSYDDRKNKKVCSHHETEANTFAANLLMPEKLIEDLYSKNQHISNSELAARLGVSEQALTIRLESLSRNKILRDSAESMEARRATAAQDMLLVVEQTARRVFYFPPYI